MCVFVYYRSLVSRSRVKFAAGKPKVTLNCDLSGKWYTPNQIIFRFCVIASAITKQRIAITCFSFYACRIDWFIIKKCEKRKTKYLERAETPRSIKWNIQFSVCMICGIRKSTNTVWCDHGCDYVNWFILFDDSLVSCFSNAGTTVDMFTCLGATGLFRLRLKLHWAVYRVAGNRAHTRNKYLLIHDSLRCYPNSIVIEWSLSDLV